MKLLALERYLHRHIPLSGAMAASVLDASPSEVRLRAPLPPNLNHRNTAFGGSVAALAILAGWVLVHLRLRAEGLEARTVIHRSDVLYLHPVEDAFEARAVKPDAEAWDRFIRAVARRGKGRIRLGVEVSCSGQVVAALDADYVALGSSEAATD